MSESKVDSLGETSSGDEKESEKIEQNDTVVVEVEKKKKPRKPLSEEAQKQRLENLRKGR